MSGDVVPRPTEARDSLAELAEIIDGSVEAGTVVQLIQDALAGSDAGLEDDILFPKSSTPPTPTKPETDLVQKVMVNAALGPS
jgi:hypothetical protein